MPANYPIRFSAQLRQHLRALRKKHGLTQAQVGDLIGVSQARIAEIEATPGLVSFEQMLQLLSALGVTLSLQEEPAASLALERLKLVKHAGKKRQPRTSDLKAEYGQPPRQRTSDLASTYSFNLPSGDWSTYHLRKGSSPSQRSVLVSSAVPKAGVTIPGQSGEKVEKDRDYRSHETDSVLKELRMHNPDKDVLPTSRRNFVIRQKKGSW